MQQKTIVFIGAGNMASTLMGGLIADGYVADRIWASDPNQDKLHQLKENLGIHVDQDNKHVAEMADILVFAVKPQVLKMVAIEVAPAILQRKPLVISIAAGRRIADMNQWLGGGIAIVRCMPNTPALIGSGATGMFANKVVTEEQKNDAESIMRAVGIALWVDDEAQMDIVTALSGSGPAYYYLVMEALEDAAVQLGLPKDTAHLLTMQTTLGAARLLLESREDTAQLRHQVTSPGGTTERALEVLERGCAKQLFNNALVAAYNRSIELAKEN